MISHLQTSIKKTTEVDSFLSSTSKKIVDKVNWMVENRGGIACLIGFILLPSQLLSPKFKISNDVIEQVSQNNAFKIEKFKLPINVKTHVQGIIYYPKNWKPQDKSSCVLYHNPNRVTVSEYLKKGFLSWTPAEILKVSNCPIVMYDYRGTGLSSNNFFGATYESILVDGETVLSHALKSFKSVKVVGSSLGGGVGTISLDRHLTKNPEDTSKVSLFNHDSFSTTPRVIIPYLPTIADCIGKIVGGMVDATTSMKSLINRGIPITILCHQDDPIIPKGARMAEFIEKLPKAHNVSLIYSSEYGHANLSPDMVQSLIVKQQSS